MYGYVVKILERYTCIIRTVEKMVAEANRLKRKSQILARRAGLWLGGFSYTHSACYLAVLVQDII
ncbi:hypothetical protein C6A49_19905 [Enterobacter hormaechei]|jgi:hypothetical protein|nr:hypothetical protein HMPREF0208_00668 [Citrobacter koseri]RCA16588.1 hypothetical protein C6A49_19905 [Enterobacter hormaechei]